MRFIGLVDEDASKKQKSPSAADAQQQREQLIKQLSQIVCICKGINLARVLKGLEGSESVEEVNRKAGTGSGGCAGERCGPRINALLKKKQAKKG